jgi:hypothetical protein
MLTHEYEVVWHGALPDPAGYGKGVLLPPRHSVPYEARVWPEALEGVDIKDLVARVRAYAPGRGSPWGQRRIGRPRIYSREEAKARHLASSREWKRRKRAERKLARQLGGGV